MTGKTRRSLYWGCGLLLAAAGAAWAQSDAAVVENGSQFRKFFVAGGPLVWAVLLPLSLVTMSLIVQFFLAIRARKLAPGPLALQVRDLAREGRWDVARQMLQRRPCLLATVLIAGIDQRSRGSQHAETIMAEELDKQVTGVLRRIEWLNIIGNVAPMIGLFGTVWGMIVAFDEIVRAGGQPEPTQLAGGISVALVTTWWGLIVAIPALAAFGILRNRLEAINAEVALAGENLLEQMDPAATSPPPLGPVPPAPRAGAEEAP